MDSLTTSCVHIFLGVFGYVVRVSNHSSFTSMICFGFILYSLIALILKISFCLLREPLICQGRLLRTEGGMQGCLSCYRGVRGAAESIPRVIMSYKVLSQGIVFPRL